MSGLTILVIDDEPQIRAEASSNRLAILGEHGTIARVRDLARVRLSRGEAA